MDRRLQALLGEDVPKEEALQLGFALFDEGMGLFQRERYADAIELFDQSLGINERYMAPSALGLCTNLNNLASAHDRLGQRGAAVYFYERALAGLHAPGAHWDEQRRRARDHVVGKLGRMRRDEADEAEDGAQLDLAQRAAAAMWEEALRLYGGGRASEAVVLFAQTLRCCTDWAPHDVGRLVTNLNNLGAAHERCGQPGEAMAYFRAAEDALERSSVQGREAKLAHVRRRMGALAQADAGHAPHGAPGGGAGQGGAGADACVPSTARPEPPQPARAQPPAPGRGPALGAGAPPAAVRATPADIAARMALARAPRPAAGAAVAHAAEDDGLPLSNDREVAE